jgi:sec-independent protein translocase protein TatA
MPNVGPMELIVILAIALIVLGPKKLPEAGRSVGKGLREFRDALSANATLDDHDDDAAPRRSREPVADAGEDERPALKSE